MLLHFFKTNVSLRACRVKSSCLQAGTHILQGLAVVFVSSLSTTTLP